MDTREKLEKLFDYQCKLDVLEIDRQAARDAILTDELKAKLKDIDDEFADKSAGAQANIAELTDAIKVDVLTGAKSVKTEHLQAVFVKGRVSWDTKGVEGYALAHPELMTYRKEGEPSVSIRRV